jgi:hypothetical protein
MANEPKFQRRLLLEQNWCVCDRPARRSTVPIRSPTEVGEKPMSIFKYVAACMTTDRRPPSSKKFRKTSNDFVFAPLTTEEVCEVLTADIDVWDNIPNCLVQSTTHMCPDEKTLSDALRFEGSVVLALVSASFFHATGSAHPRELITLSEETKKFADAGFDVCDSSVLSALVNIGYNALETRYVRSLGLQVNRHGLLSAELGAEVLARYADTVATEHAPFFPMKILARVAAG